MLSLPTSEESCDNCIRDFSRVSNVFTYKSAEKSDHFLYSKVNEVMSLAQQFAHSIVKFQSFSLFVTSFDIFRHYLRTEDDCAQSVEAIFSLPTANVSRKTYTDKNFMEISIRVGNYEFSAVGGYIKMHDNLLPFLALLWRSSMFKIILQQVPWFLQRNQKH